QIGQRAGDEQAMRVLLQPAIAHLSETEYPLDDPDRMFDPGPHPGLGAVFGPLDLVDDTAMAIAAVDEVLSLGRMLADHGPLARGRPDHPTRGSHCRAAARAAPCCRRHWPA